MVVIDKATKISAINILIFCFNEIGENIPVFKPSIFETLIDRAIKKPMEGKYSQCSAISVSSGRITLDTGTKFRKNQISPKKIGLENLYEMITNPITMHKRVMEIKKAGSSGDVISSTSRSI